MLFGMEREKQKMTDEQQQMINDCLARASKMNDWECDFIHDLSYQNFLTKGQANKLEDIWEKIT